MKKKIVNVLCVLALLLLVWAVASFVDVVAHNLTDAPSFQAWNLFQLIK